MGYNLLITYFQVLNLGLNDNMECHELCLIKLTSSKYLGIMYLGIMYLGIMYLGIMYLFGM